MPADHLGDGADRHAWSATACSVDPAGACRRPAGTGAPRRAGARRASGWTRRPGSRKRPCPGRGDDRGHEAVITVPVHRRRQPEHGRADAAVGQRQRELCRLAPQLRAAAVLGPRRAVPVPFCGHPPRGHPERPGRDDQRPARTGQHVAERRDGRRSASPRLRSRRKTQSCLNARWTTPSARPPRCAAVEIIGTPRCTCTPAAVRRRRGVRAGQPGDLMTRADHSGTTAEPIQPEAPVTKTRMRKTSMCMAGHRRCGDRRWQSLSSL